MWRIEYIYTDRNIISTFGYYHYLNAFDHAFGFVRDDRRIFGNKSTVRARVFKER